MRKIILRTHLSPGDIVMLTAAVRDLHRAHPGQFATDVRTLCPALWENNPHLTPLSETDPEVEDVPSDYPLINRSDEAPYHCLHGFIEFLNEKFDLRIKPTLFKGDIHLSEQEKGWYSQIHELTGEETPFWIVASGGKYDATVKWWSHARFQAVADHFRGRIQFVQTGAPGHFHPKLEGVIDLRGRTDLRELVRLVYHAQGVLCGVTALMHLAAAVETKPGQPRNRPCVVVAGGREPVHWEAYPDHQFIATNGFLPCCSDGGCWRARVVPLGDGDEKDQPENLCVRVRDGLPQCMEMISAAEVIRRIEGYFDGGMIEYLSGSQAKGARRGVRASRKNDYDDAPLTLHNARLMCERFIKTIPEYPDGCQGRGIVICAGEIGYFTNAWVCVNLLRLQGCALPVQFWHRGPAELDAEMASLVAPLGVECVDLNEVARRFPRRRAGAWEAKPYAILHSRFQEVLFLDADNMPVVNPEFLFDSPQYRETGAIFWPDYGQFEKSKTAWQSCGMEQPPGPEFESGQILVDKARCWRALSLTLWFNEQSDFYYEHLYGDKETFHLAFHKLKKAYGMVETPVFPLTGTMCQHDFEGRRLFQHRNTDKWNLFLRNKVVEGFRFEEECRRFVRELREKWDGRASVYRPKPGRPPAPAIAARSRHPVQRIQACMISCLERETLRSQTLRNLAATDWGGEPVLVRMDDGRLDERRARQTETALLALRHGLEAKPDYLLFLEDDLEFNRHLRHNLLHWEPLRAGAVTLAGLYSPNNRHLACDVAQNWTVIEPRNVFGSQAFLLSRRAAEYLVRWWEDVEGMQDVKMSRLAARMKSPLYFHAPSLVQHVGRESVWGGKFHQAWDFDPEWKADAPPARSTPQFPEPV